MKHYNQLQKLIGYRGTKKQISKAIEQLTLVPTHLYKFENNLPESDLGFQFNLGMDGEEHLDFDIYLIKTRAKDGGKPVWYVTEINPSY